MGHSTGAPSRRAGGSLSWWLLGAIVLLGVVVRFPTLGEQSFWYDEAITHGIVAHGFGHVLSTVPQSESTPPLYYVIVWLWSRVSGLHEFGLRAFSALCGTVTIPVVWLLGKRVVSERVGLVAATLTAVNPLLFWYSQEARAYALLVLISALSLLALLWATESPRPRRLLAWGGLCAVALATHYFAVFLVVAETGWLLYVLRRRGSARPIAVVCGLAPIAVVGAALLPLVVHQADGRASFIADRSGSLGFRAVQFVRQDVVAFDQPAKTLTSITAVVLVGFALVLLVRRADRREREGVLMPLVVGAGAVLLALLIAAVGTDYVNTRNLLPSWPALVVVVATGFGSARSGWLGRWALLALVTISAACVVGVVSDTRFQRADWRGAAMAMGPPTIPRAIVADHNAPGALEPYATGISSFPATLPIQEVDVFALVYRKTGARVSSYPPRPAVPPALPGFTVVERRETDGYTLLRYRSHNPVLERPAALVGLGLSRGGQYIALLQQPQVRVDRDVRRIRGPQARGGRRAAPRQWGISARRRARAAAARRGL